MRGSGGASRALMALAASVLAVLAIVPRGADARGGERVARAQISVDPAVGSYRTKFTVSFRAPARTGRFGGVERRYVVSVAGPAGAQGCVDGTDRQLPFARVHARVRSVLDPAAGSGRWCKGSYKGRVEEVAQPVCTQHRACPLYVRLLGTVGTFRFEVAAKRPR